MRTLAAKTLKKSRQTNWSSVRENEPFFYLFSSSFAEDNVP
jgi:hypothetical protein